MGTDDPLAQFAKDCASYAPEVGAATGAVYGHGAEAVGLGPAGAAAVEKTIGDFVTENWPHSCALPAAIAEVVKDVAQSPAIDPAPAAPDTSISPSD